jgi:branched-subunit amino acid ABC-type transport system permease component
VLITGVFAIGMDLGVFSHVRRASPAAKMVLSVGLAMIIRSVIAIVFGSKALTLGYLARPIPKMLELFGLRATDLQVTILAITMVSMILFGLLLQRTKLGKTLRATADNPLLAEAKGINTASVIRWMWFISGGFAGLGGCLIGLETQLRPGLGMYVLMPMFAAATVGGLGSPFGAVAGALLIAVAQNSALGIDFGKLVGLDTWRIDTGYKSGIALLALVGTLLVRPRGIFGKRGG